MSRIVFALRVAGDDSLWVATPDGLSHLQDGAIRNSTTADGLSSDRTLDIHQDRNGEIWVATQGGVDRFVSGRFVSVPATQGDDEVLARRFVEDSRGDLYTTDTPHGIGQIRKDQLQLVNGTLDLMEAVETPDRSIWFTSRGGIARFQEEEFGREGDPGRPLGYQLFNRADGLNTTQASVGSPNIAATPDGKLWIATVDGLAMISTSLLPQTGRRPQVFVAGVSADGKPTRIGSELVLPPGVHHVELSLAAVSPANPQKVRLQYLLEDVDAGWLDADTSRVAVYTGIPAGTHRMLVRETDTLGNWSAPTLDVLSRLRSRKGKPENLTEAYAAIGNELRSLGDARLEVIVDGRSRDLDNAVQEELLKIGREALFNAWRHAQAKKIEVEVHFGFFELRIHFRDNGVGIDPAILRQGSVDGHFGLPGMRERTAKLGGRMVLWSRPGAGTEVDIRIPGVIAYRHSKRREGTQWIRKVLRSRAL